MPAVLFAPEASCRDEPIEKQVEILFRMSHGRVNRQETEAQKELADKASKSGSWYGRVRAGMQIMNARLNAGRDPFDCSEWREYAAALPEEDSKDWGSFWEALHHNLIVLAGEAHAIAFPGPKLVRNRAGRPRMPATVLDKLKGRGFAMFSSNIVPKVGQWSKDVILKDGKEQKEFAFPEGWAEFTADQNDKNVKEREHLALAIVTGKPSGIDAVDWDTAEVWADACEHMPWLETRKDIWLTKTRRGYHLQIKSTGLFKNTACNGVDMRTDGGCIIVEPSIYFTTTGEKISYTNVNDCYEPLDLDEVPELRAYLLERFAKAPPRQATQAGDTKPIAGRTAPSTGRSAAEDWELLFGMINTNRFADGKGHSEWVRLCYAVAGEVGEEGRELFVAFSDRCSANKAAEADAKFTYCLARAEQASDKKATIGTAKYFAKTDAPAEYRASFGSCGAGDGRGVKDDKEAAMRMVEIYPYWVYCGEKLYVLDNETGLRSSVPAVHRRIIMEHSDDLNILRKNKDGDWVPSGQSYGTSVTRINAVLALIPSFCANENWLESVNRSALGKLLFPNGWLDCKTGEFHDDNCWDPDIVFFDRIYNPWVEFETDEEIAYKREVRKLVFENILGSVTDFFLLRVSRGLAGDRQKKFLMGIAGTNAGKSKLSKAILKAVGGYGASFDANMLIYRNTSSEAAQQMRPFMLLAYKRLCFANELNVESVNGQKTKLNGTLTKMISGGDTQTGRTHGKTEVEFECHPLFGVFANDGLEFTPLDDAIGERVDCIPMKKQGTRDEVTDPETQFKIDPKFDEYIANPRFQQAIVSILMDAYLEFQRSDCVEVCPKEVQYESKEWVGKTTTPMAAFGDEFEITNNADDFVPSRDIEKWLKGCGMGWSMKKFSIELKKHCAKAGFSNVENKGVKNKKTGGKNVQAWVGIKLIEEIFEDEEVTSESEPAPKPLMLKANDPLTLYIAPDTVKVVRGDGTSV